VGAEYDLADAFLRAILVGTFRDIRRSSSRTCRSRRDFRRELSLQRAAPADGTVIGSVSRNIPIQAALGRDNLKADPRRFGWLGGSGLPSRVCYVAQSSPIRSPRDLFERELIVGGAGAGSSLSFLPIALQRVLYMKFRLVEGYRASPTPLSRFNAARSRASATATTRSTRKRRF
jgi:hypothetical protein